MRKIIVFTILVLIAFTSGVNAQSTWKNPWPGATHSYMASVIDPENDNPVRWYVTTDAAGTQKALYNTDYSFVTNGYNAATNQLEGTAVYVVEITWGANLGNYYIVLEVEDNVTHCTNRMALPIQIESSFNAFVTDMIADPSCPGDIVNPLWNGSDQTDIGNTELEFRIERQNSMFEWQFEFQISESSFQSFSIDSIRFVSDLGASVPELNQSANLTTGQVSVDANNDWVLAKIYIRNQMGVSLHFNFDLLTNHDLTRDAGNNLDKNLADNSADHTIWPMPVITNFSGN